MNDVFDKLEEFRARGIPAMLVTVVAKDGEGPVEPGKKMVVGANGEAAGTVGGGAIERCARDRCAALIASRSTLLERYLLREGRILADHETLPMACGGTATLFYDYVGPKGFVYIFGAGHVGQALANVLRTLSFHITVVDDREDVLGAFANADVKVLKPFASFIDEEGLRADAFVVVCTPSHRYDYHVMNRILEKGISVRYVGMLCSETKIAEYLEKTYAAFGRDVDLSRFYSPVGLDLGGGSPEEIAISIAAEMLAVANGRTGHSHMREARCHGHDRYWEH
jgi:xanthine dehydrogenase accessory factor